MRTPFPLGRGLERYDKCAVDEIAKKLAGHHYRFSALVNAVVESTPFEQRRGDGHKEEAAALGK